MALLTGINRAHLGSRRAAAQLGDQMLVKVEQGQKFEEICKAAGVGTVKGRKLLIEAVQRAKEGLSTPQTSSQPVVQRAPDAAEIGRAARLTLDAILNEDALREVVRAEVAKFPPQSRELTIVHEKSGKVTDRVKIKTSHQALGEALASVDAGFDNILLVGPAGSGKSTLAEQLAQSLKRDFGFLSLSGGTTESQLLGRITSAGKYLPALFVTLFEKGGVFLLDEVDAGDANVLLVLNSALANGNLAVPARVDKPTAKRHPNFVLICAANTWGTGADWQYVGRNQLDAAFLSRFAGAVLEVGYDPMLEQSLTDAAWYVAFVGVRNAAILARLRRVLGTRELLAGQRWLTAGRTTEQVWKKLTTGWTHDELNKARISQC